MFAFLVGRAFIIDRTLPIPVVVMVEKPSTEAIILLIDEKHTTTSTANRYIIVRLLLAFIIRDSIFERRLLASLFMCIILQIDGRYRCRCDRYQCCCVSNPVVCHLL
mmetsp:Transcript_2247/g.2482  ORF Transcript_2247/g.2482 Transcript_2247/m.2482 type:complete len:107 (-) Transcript_2247:5-325(-)